MPITINTSKPTPPMEPPSPHGKAAEALAMTTAELPPTDDGQAGAVTHENYPTDDAPETEENPQKGKRDTYVTCEVGFKMPVAPYTMYEIRCGITLLCHADEADEVFEAARTWVEGKVNEIVAEQQAQE